MTIPGEVEPVLDLLTEHRLALLQRTPMQYFGDVPESLIDIQGPGVLLEPFPGLECQDHACKVHLELHPISDVVVKEVVGIVSEVQQCLQAVTEVGLVAVAGHPDEETGEARGERGPQRERAVTFEQPADALEEDARCSDGAALRHGNLGGVAVTRGSSRAASVEHRHLAARAGQPVSAGQADYASTYHEDFHAGAPLFWSRPASSRLIISASSRALTRVWISSALRRASIFLLLKAPMIGWWPPTFRY